MFDFIARWLGKEKTVQTRMSKEEAIARARAAASNDPLSEHLTIASVQERSGRLVWIVGSATTGLILEVSIDDASAEVLDMKRLGLR